MAIQIAVCGPETCTSLEEERAVQVGRLLAARGVTVLCGGGAGVMAAVARGVREQGGLIIGVRPDADRSTASPDLSAVVVTNLGQARNAVLAWSADAVVVIGGSWGTLSEVALAMRRGGVPVISLGGWQVLDADGAPVPGVTPAATPAEAVERALAG